MKIVDVICDLCKKKITHPNDHFEFVVHHQYLSQEQMTVVNGVAVPLKQTEKKVLDFHNKCNQAFKSEYNNIMTMLQKEFEKGEINL